MAVALLGSFALTLTSAQATVDQTYTMTGTDRYRIGKERHDVRFTGRERLTTVAREGAESLSVFVRYAREEGTGRPWLLSFEEGAESLAVADVHGDADLDYVSLFNQPLPLALAPEEIATIETMSGRMPFSLPSRIGAGSLAGYFRRAQPPLASNLVGVAFAATSKIAVPIHGTRHVIARGVLKLSGHAYYSRRTGIVNRIESILEFTGVLPSGGSLVPVQFTFEREIHNGSTTIAKY